MLDVLDADLVVDSNVELESGSLTWKEVAIDGRSRSSCARSDHDEKRARIIGLANEVVTVSLTSTSTMTETAATTKTFSIMVSFIIGFPSKFMIFLGLMYHSWFHIWRSYVLERNYTTLCSMNLIISPHSWVQNIYIHNRVENK